MHVRGNAKMLLPDAANNCRCWSPVLFIVDVHICRIYLPLIKKHDTQVSCISDDAIRHCNLCIHSHDAGVPSHVHILYSSFLGYICQPSFAFVSPCLFWVVLRCRSQGSKCSVCVWIQSWGLPDLRLQGFPPPFCICSARGNSWVDRVCEVSAKSKSYQSLRDCLKVRLLGEISMTVELGLLTSFPGNNCTNHLCLHPTASLGSGHTWNNEV